MTKNNGSRRVIAFTLVFALLLVLINSSTFASGNYTSYTYGSSGKGTPLYYYKISGSSATGNKIAVLVFEQHGFEDAWDKDGNELVTIGNYIRDYMTPSYLGNWTLYVVSSPNPDGLNYGTTNCGPGRCVVVKQVNMNRNYPSNYQSGGSTPPPIGSIGAYNYAGTSSLCINETSNLASLLKSLKTSSVTSAMLIDFHGWMNYAQGSSTICNALSNQFSSFTNIDYEYNVPNSHDSKKTSFYTTGYNPSQPGFLYNYAYNLGYASALMEYPWPQDSSGNHTHDSTIGHNYINSNNYSGKTLNALRVYFAAN